MRGGVSQQRTIASRHIGRQYVSDSSLFDRHIGSERRRVCHCHRRL